MSQNKLHAFVLSSCTFIRLSQTVPRAERWNQGRFSGDFSGFLSKIELLALILNIQTTIIRASFTIQYFVLSFLLFSEESSFSLSSLYSVTSSLPMLWLRPASDLRAQLAEFHLFSLTNSILCSGPDEDLNALSYIWQTYYPVVLRNWKQQLLWRD